MKFKNLKLRTRTIGAIAVVILLLFVGMYNAVANTVTITDLSVSDDSGLLINFTEDSSQFTRVSIGGVNFTDGGISDNVLGEMLNFTIGWFSFNNGSFGGVREINGSYDNKDTFITNSNGNSWPATGANLVTACAAMVSGEELTVPPGHFKLTEDIDFINNTKILGSGMGTTFIEATTGYTDANGDCIFGSFALPGGRNNITISDMTIDGNWSLGAGDARGCISISTSIGGTPSCDITLKNLVLKSPYNRGALRIGRNSTRLQISNIYSYNVSGSFHSFSFGSMHDSVVSDLIGWDNTNVIIDVSKCTNCTFNGGVLKSSGMGMKIIGDATYPTENCEFNNFVIDDIDSGGYSLRLQSYVLNSSLNNFVIEGGSLVEVGLTTRSLNLNNWHISGTSSYGLHLRGKYHHLDNFFISNPGNIGLFVDGLTDSVISNGDVYGSPEHGIKLTAASNYNTFNSVVSRSNTKCGVQLEGSNNNTFDTCTLKDNTLDGLEFAGTACRDNSVLGCTINSNGDNGIELKWGTVFSFIKINDNTISYNDDDGIDIGTTAKDNITINDNFINFNGADGTGYGIDIAAEAHINFIITGNNLLGNPNDNDNDMTGTNVTANNLGTWV
jgi:hypothetical protein